MKKPELNLQFAHPVGLKIVALSLAGLAAACGTDLTPNGSPASSTPVTTEAPATTEPAPATSDPRLDIPTFAPETTAPTPATTAPTPSLAPPSPSETPSAVPSDALVSGITLSLNYDKLNPNGTCENGVPRPCYSPLRSAPNYSASYLNIAGEWPTEGRDKLEVVCQVSGALVIAGALSPNDPRRTSSVWDVVKVTPDHLSVTGLRRAESPQPGFGVEKDPAGNITAVYPFVPDMWLGNHGIYDQLAPCTTGQNP